MAKKIDIYEEITNKIIASMEKGVLPWRRPWNADISLPRRSNGVAYRGVNVVLLWLAEVTNNYQHHMFMTYAQARSMNAHIRKGEHGHPIIKVGTFVVEDEEDGEEKEKKYMKQYTVFNVEQIEGLPEEPVIEQKSIKDEDRYEKLNQLVSSLGVKIHVGSYRACYVNNDDIISMPDISTFETPDAYFTTLFHEIGHWTGHKSRLNRVFGQKKTDAAYAFEELVAELTSCFVCANFGIARVDATASYVDSWLVALKRDKKFFTRACNYAQTAADYILNHAK